ncbi:MAG: acetyl-CoA hydrolase/transferase C-terminal domain-containing protein [Anaerolineae bacterium]
MSRNKKTQYLTAEEAVEFIKSGDRVFMTGNCSVPQKLLRALVDRAPQLTDVELVQLLAISDVDYVAPELAGHLRVNAMFISHNVREAVNDGRADFTPILLSDVPRLFRRREKFPINVALVHLSPPDMHGYCSYGVEVGLTKTGAEVADLVIAEVNAQMPRALGDSMIHIDDIDIIVETDYPLPEIQMTEANELQQQIARHIVELIPDGATLQTGIGAVPDAVLRLLTNHRDLGVHTELFSDGVIDLVERGVINCRAKTLHPGKMVAGFVLGTRRLYDFIHDNPICEFHPTEYVNNPYVISQNARMVAINSALEVDLTGQVCADSMGHYFFSGVGGQLDFIRGAGRAEGGVPIIALPSTAKGGQLSRIVPELKPGAGVTTTRNDVHWVVTEYGAADLFGVPVRERVRRLINIAHPDFREELARVAYERYHVNIG